MCRRYNRVGGFKMDSNGVFELLITVHIAQICTYFDHFLQYFPTYQYAPHLNYGGNGGGQTPINYYSRPNFNNHMNTDFASLPPAVNMLNHSKDLRIDSQDILDGLEQRR